MKVSIYYAAWAVAFVTLAGPASAETFTAKQCRDAISISTAIMTKYRGRISAKLVASFGQFRDSNCDLTISFTRAEGTADEEAFREFRLKLIALRS